MAAVETVQFRKAREGGFWCLSGCDRRSGWARVCLRHWRLYWAQRRPL